MMKSIKKLVAVIVSAQILGGVAMADDTADAIAALKKQIELLSAKVQQLEDEHQTDVQARNVAQPTQSALASTNVPLKAPPFITAGPEGFSLQSADTNFTLRLHGMGQFDSHYYASPNPGAKDTFTIRRLRAVAAGKVYQNFDYYMQTDFGSGTTSTTTNNAFLQDAYVNFHYWPGFQFQGGKFKEPVGLEILPADENLWFVERGYPTELVPNRDVGAEVHGELFNGALNYAAGAFNGVPDGGSGDIEVADNDKDVAARIFAVPFTNSSIAALKNFGFGIGTSYGFQAGSTTPSFATLGRQTFFKYASGAGTSTATRNVTEAGDHFRFVPQGYYFWGPAGFYWEYADSSEKFQLNNGKTHQAWFDNKGWDVSASWFLTGEKDNFWAPPAPLHNFHIDGSGLGAWQLTARIGGLSLDKGAFASPASHLPVYAASGSADQATSWGVGLNWFLNRNIKWVFEYEQTSFGFAPGYKATPGTVSAQDEKTFMTRLQFAF